MGLYSRHGSQGGKFKRGDFGDLGLRAYADARNREIKVAEEQLQQQQIGILIIIMVQEDLQNVLQLLQDVIVKIILCLMDTQQGGLLLN